jgi:hypothetical protein
MTKQYLPYPKKKYKEMKETQTSASGTKKAGQKPGSSGDGNKIPLSKDILSPLKKQIILPK